MVLKGSVRMMSTAVILLMMAVCALSSPHGLALSGCEEDHECAENMFCYKMRSCVECYNCALYYRKPNAKKICAREPSECGECIDGYEADILTSGFERDYCRAAEKAPTTSSGPAPSISNTTFLLVGCGIVAIVVAVAGYVIYKWRKIKNRGGDQPVQNVQESHHVGSGNGLSPLLGNVNERKASLGEQTSCNRPSAPPQPSPAPPPYESSAPPLRDEAPFVMERMVKCNGAVCFKEPNLQISSFPIEEPDDQSTDESDAEVNFHPDINIESGYPSAFHEEDTLPASADGSGWPREERIASDAAGATVDGALLRLAGPSSHYEACQARVSSTSQASSSASLSSDTVMAHSSSEGPVAKRQKFDSGNSSTAEDLQEDEETWRSQETPRINVQAVTVLNVQNVINYNIQNTFNTP